MSDTTTTTTAKTRTITLTDRPPVTIREDDWPCIAEALCDDDVSQDGNPSRNRYGHIRVRQHADGRAIIYARYTFDTRWQGEQGWRRRAGVLLPAGATMATIIDAIRSVHRSIDVETEDWQRLAQECIADLPAEVL